MSRKKRRQPNPQQFLSPSVDVEVKSQQAISLYQAGQLQQAEQICQQILRNYPQHAKALHLLDDIAYQVRENEVAIGLITQAIEMDSTQYVFFNSLGAALQEQDRLEESIQAYQHHIQPGAAEAYYNLGNILREQGRLEKSIQAYQKSIEIQPDLASTLFS